MTHVNKMLYNNLTGYGHVVQLVCVSSVGDVANMFAKWSLALKHIMLVIGDGEALLTDTNVIVAAVFCVWKWNVCTVSVVCRKRRRSCFITQLMWNLTLKSDRLASVRLSQSSHGVL